MADPNAKKMGVRHKYEDEADDSFEERAKKLGFSKKEISDLKLLYPDEELEEGLGPLLDED